MTGTRSRFKSGEAVRFLINGVASSLLHFLVLWICFKLLNFHSSGLSNIVASIFGISFSFLGNRYFVFQEHTETIMQQLSKFIGLYVAIALIHGISSFVITDIYKIDYRIGFVFALAVQTIFGFLGSKFLVFSK